MTLIRQVMHEYVTLTGCPGTGKSTLLPLLANALASTPIHEKVERHPFVRGFYAHKRRWTFHLSMFYILDAIKMSRKIRAGLSAGKRYIQDYEFLTHFEVHCRFLKTQRLLSSAEFRMCKQVHGWLLEQYVHPDVIILLKAQPPSLLERLQERDRLAESDKFDLAYLRTLNTAFERWASQHNGRLLHVDTTQFHYGSERQRKAVLSNLISRIGGPHAV